MVVTYVLIIHFFVVQEELFEILFIAIYNIYAP